MTAANDLLLNCMNRIENVSPESVKIILGDFNGSNFDEYVPSYQQFVNCTTREDRILDLMFCNVKHSYCVKKMSPLGNSDHCMLFCLPTYRQKLKREKPCKVTVRNWNEDCLIELQGCFEWTDWSVLYNVHSDLQSNVDVFTSYIDFCTNMIVPSKCVTIYSNNKPWVTKDVKLLLNEKKRALATHDRSRLKEVQKELNGVISEAKKNYKLKVEEMFKSNNSKDAWKGLKVLCGYQSKNSNADPENICDYVNELNKFYSRFDVHDFSAECENVLIDVKRKNDLPIVISVDDVTQSLKRIRIGKSCGPDHINARVIRACAEQLAQPLQVLFQDSLDSCSVPSSWKLSEVIPVPKIKFPVVYNDTRPVALTSLLMKCLEHIVKKYLCRDISDILDPLQFAYRTGKSVQDAVLTLMHQVTEHLEKSNSCVRVLYIDFSSAFNTIQTHILLRKLLKMKVNSHLISWIHSFMSNRTQYVKFKNVKSNTVCTFTGAPQGCVLSPLLFSLYTNDCRSSSVNCTVVKYADDTAIIGKIVKDDNSCFLKEVESFVNWCDSNYLDLNVKKTKEMIFDFRTDSNVIPPVKINSEHVEKVSEYKYLGIIIDEKLTGSPNTKRVYSKCIQRIHHLRILRNIHVSKTILSLFYKSIVESVLCFPITVWFGSLNCKDKHKLEKIVNMARKLSVDITPLNVLYDKYVLNIAEKIRADEHHPLRNCYVLLPSGRRLSMPKIRTTRFKNTFVPKSIRLLNHVFSRQPVI